ncbi:MAG: putative repeat protein (TIGR01451 family) [Rhodothermales bacterium]|jgi:uncharacterized repeat protein (TIGR01451 family)
MQITTTSVVNRLNALRLAAILLSCLAVSTPATAQSPVNLGSSGNFAILSKSGITNVPTSSVWGDVGTSPITGAALLLTCAQVTGNVFTVDPAGPLPCRQTEPAFLTGAVLDMEAAYTDAAFRPSPDFVELGAGEIGGRTLSPGIYKWGTGLLISTDVTFSGGPNDVWILQVAGTLTQASAKRVILTGGAQAKNIFWAVAGVAAIGTTAHFEGILLAKTMIAVKTGASVNGRLMAQTAVTLQMNTIHAPGMCSIGSLDPDCVDLELLKLASSDEASLGDEIQFSLAITNTSAQDAHGVGLSDDIPAGLSFLSSPDGMNAGQLVTWSGLTIPAGQTVTKTFLVTATQAGTYRNCSEIEAMDETDPDSTPGNFNEDAVEDDESCATVAIQGISDVEIHGVVWDDVNKDGVQNQGEAGLEGIRVAVYSPGPDGDSGTPGDNVDETVITDENGSYWLTNLSPGEYVVNVDESGAPQGSVVTTDDPVEIWIGAGSNVAVNFGIMLPGGVVQGTIFADVDQNGIQNGGELGLAYVTLTLFDLGADGVPGTYDDGPSRIVTTASDGSYIIQGLPDSNYLLSVDDPSGFIATSTEPRPITISGGTTENVDIGFANNKKAQIGDQVFKDLNGNGVHDQGEPGIGDVTVTLYVDANENGVLDYSEEASGITTTTNYAGFYNFAGLMPGFYLVQSSTPSQHVASSGGDPLAFYLVGGQVVTVADFGFLPNGGSIYGIVSGMVFQDLNTNGAFDSGESGFKDVTVKLFSMGPDYLCGTPDDQFIAAETTDGYGNFSFDGLYGGTYCVLVDEAGLPADPSITTVGNPATVFVQAGDTIVAKFGYHFGSKIDLELDKSADKTAVSVGEVVTFTLKVRNAAGAHTSATNVIVKDYLPSGLQYVSYSATQGQGLVFDPTRLTWTVEWIGVGQEVLLSFRARVTKAGEFRNCAEVWDADQHDKDSTTGDKRGTAFDRNATREDDEDCFRIWTGTSAKIDLELDKVVDNAYPAAGTPVKFTLNLTNKGDVPATGVMLVDYLPAGLTYVWDTATTGTGITFSPSKLTWTIASIAKGQTITVSLKAMVNVAGEWTNYAEVWDANEADDDSQTGEDRGTQFDPSAPREDDEASASVWAGQRPSTDALCYLVADNDNTGWDSRDVLSKLTSQGQVETIIGRTGTRQVESLAFNPWTKVLYAANANSLGTVNTQTGVYTDIGEFGEGEGYMANGNYRTRGLLDVDGLAFDALNGDLWGSSRKTGEPDLLFKINPATGAHIENAFGSGKDFISILTNDGLNDIDDIAIDPTNGTLYAINNEDGTQSRLVTIDKQTGWISAILPLPVDNVEGLDFYSDGTLYATAGEGSEAIIIIDKGNWTTQVVTSIGTGGNRDYEAIACLTAPTNYLKVNVFEDLDDNGRQDMIEVPLVGVDVQLYRDVDGDGFVGIGDPLVMTGLSDNNGEVEFVTAASGKFVYRMAGGFVRGIGLQTPTNLEGFGQTARSYLGVGASVSVDVDEETEVPTDYQLHSNYPNPFNPSTTIAFDLPQTEKVTLAVFDVLGRRVALLLNGIQQAGKHQVVFDGTRLASGAYLYRMSTPTRTVTRTMLLVK